MSYWIFRQDHHSGGGMGWFSFSLFAKAYIFLSLAGIQIVYPYQSVTALEQRTTETPHQQACQLLLMPPDLVWGRFPSSRKNSHTYNHDVTVPTITFRKGAYQVHRHYLGWVSARNCSQWGSGWMGGGLPWCTSGTGMAIISHIVVLTWPVETFLQSVKCLVLG